MEEGLHLKRKDPEHFNEAAVAYSLHGLANVYSIMKEEGLADASYQDALAMKVHFYGQKSNDVARTQLRYAESLGSDRKSLMLATSLLDEALGVFKLFLSEDQFEVQLAQELFSKKLQQLQVLPEPLQASPSLLLTLLSGFLHPWHVGGPESRFYKTLNDAPGGTKEFMQVFQPSLPFRERFLENLGPRFAEHARQFARDGLLIVPGYITNLACWDKWYTSTMNRVGSYQRDLHMKTFTATSHERVEICEEVLRCIADPYLLALITFAAGGLVKLSDFRAATTFPGPEVLFRAWKWHRDGGKEPEWKIMVLLDDVRPGGSEMHYLKQSMRCWKGLRQKDANFSMDDALSIAAAGSSALPPITRCFGRAGTDNLPTHSLRSEGSLPSVSSETFHTSPACTLWTLSERIICPNRIPGLPRSFYAEVVSRGRTKARRSA
ncbi:unnamed protein product [Effrenium voratum]|uniref:Uncharacterized protein n=1 Tax=Effrenium voratum TaxID=2562239 RepID=A0AA36MSJ5_9DINO|nr:unnamed protein product [Effrenium voratum]CAJ1421648.1 unnamed protein product [Effrenium voratum]CAJ1441913.1 unnamed protein product [Effrenium voratum]